MAGNLGFSSSEQSEGHIYLNPFNTIIFTPCLVINKYTVHMARKWSGLKHIMASLSNVSPLHINSSTVDSVPRDLWLSSNPNCRPMRVITRASPYRPWPSCSLVSSPSCQKFWVHYHSPQTQHHMPTREQHPASNVDIKLWGKKESLKETGI